ncbi:TetR/AcrR family transcriptional regulator [Nocardioides zeae]|uniref:TetR/AcrR family transcriptional regulator n=1 Tax=Nocardioides zeae TaxID=1457234 RepID=A0A6P0HP77_9ACTN|nr:TetR/AcrR family transcriptional regulator [Nocardioides zeae]NEN80438.1 TetR/AcrR family transcriptional regulator [Nocardioides zeae]
MAQRTRDPDRREKILEAAAGLLADNGYHAVSMAEIGERAGIVGSGIYRHFGSKAAILVELFERVIDDLLEQGRAAVEGTTDLAAALDELVRGQVGFVVHKRHLAQIYHNEISNLPREDQVRLRRKQRLYLEEWVHVLAELEQTSEPVTRTRVNVAIGAIQAVLFHQVVLPDDELTAMLTKSAHAILTLA